MPTTESRVRKGAVLGLVAVLALALVMIAVAFFVISLYLGGGREVRNATDAGALNVGRKVLGLRTITQSDDEAQYKDVSDAQFQFGLTNINRVWGKALLAAANAQEIQNDGCSNADTTNHISALYNGAESISNRIADKLTTPGNLYPLFNEVSTANSVRMLGEQSTTKALPTGSGGKWSTSLMNRGDESNLILKDNQLPSGVSVTTVTAKNNDPCLPGYQPVNMFGRTYWFVPFKFNERPRLESKNHFDAETVATKPLNPSWSKPVPNAFSCTAATEKGASANEKAMAWVKANPMLTFKARIPHGFIRLKFEDNTACWFWSPVAPPITAVLPAPIIPPGIPVPHKTKYGYKTENQFREIYIPTCGTGSASVTLGKEYPVPTVWNCLFPPTMPQPSHLSLQKRMVQRMRQVNPEFSLGMLTAILNTVQVTDTKREFYIVPALNGTIVCVAEDQVSNVAPWMTNEYKNQVPDSSKKVFQELFPPIMEPNTINTWIVKCVSLTSTAGVAGTVSSMTDGDGDLDWRGGTGYNGCLGEITVKRETNLRFTGACSCVVWDPTQADKIKIACINTLSDGARSIAKLVNLMSLGVELAIPEIRV